VYENDSSRSTLLLNIKKETGIKLKATGLPSIPRTQILSRIQKETLSVIH